jgi:serine/threonine protein kinase
VNPCRGDIIAGKLRLERTIAQGGMGAVWLAHNEQLDVPVAVKFMTAARQARVRRSSTSRSTNFHSSEALSAASGSSNAFASEGA